MHKSSDKLDNEVMSDLRFLVIKTTRLEDEHFLSTNDGLADSVING